MSKTVFLIIYDGVMAYNDIEVRGSVHTTN